MNGSSHLGQTTRQRGFTTVELLVAMGLFVVVVSIASAVFISALRNQGRLADLMTVYNSAGLALEQAMREARTGRGFLLSTRPDADDCSAAPAVEKLRFISTKGTEDFYVRYFLCRVKGGDNGIARSIMPADGDVAVARLTGRNVDVKHVGISLVGVGDDLEDPGDNDNDKTPPRLTVSICLRLRKAVMASDIPLCMQNTVTARDTDN